MRRRTRTPPVSADEPAPGAGPVGGAPGAEADRLAGYRLVRRIASGDRADIYLAAVVDPRGRPAETPELGEHRRLVAMRVYDAAAEAEVIATEVEAMAVVSSLPELLDVATLPDRRSCVVVERLAGPTLAAIVVGRGLTAGEAVTLLAPVFAGVHELERHGFAHVRLAVSDVMLDGSGRARLIGTGGLRRLDEASDDPAARTALVREMYAALSRLIGDVSAVTRPQGALDPVRHLLDELLAVRPFRTRAEELERMLFAVAAPAPVTASMAATTGPAGARRHRSVDRREVRPDEVVPESAATRADRANGSWADATPASGASGSERQAARSQGWLPRAFSSFDAVIHETLGDGEADVAQPGRWRAMRARTRSAIARRRSVLIVGALAGAAALVVVLTLVPPEEAAPDGHDEATKRSSVQPVATSGADEDDRAGDGAPDPTGAEHRAALSGSDAAAAAVELLGLRRRCFAERDAACLEPLLQPGSGLETADRALMTAVQGGEAPTPELEFASDRARVIGEMGGAWLIEVPYREPERQPASILVMRSEAGWRLREIFG